MTKKSAATPQACSPKASRGFTLLQTAQIVRVEFDSNGDLWLRQGQDQILICANAVEVFKRGMTWVRADVISSANP